MIVVDRGHIGIGAFKHIVTDPRTKDLPLILETPGFDKMDIWTKEIDVLNRISASLSESRSLSKEPAVGNGDAVKKDGDEEAELNELASVPVHGEDEGLEGYLNEIKQAVAESQKGAKTKSPGKANGRKRKRKDEGDEEGDGECDHSEDD